MKKILITGGAGFIGKHLCEKLLKRGDEVIVLDNLFSSSKNNIKALLSHERFEFIRHDVIEPINLEIEEIYHLACPASPVHYQYNAIKTIKTNVLGTINMLGLAKRVKAKILFASTSEIYGTPLEHPQKESHWGNVNPVGVRSCYDEGKRVAETLFMDYYRSNQVDIRIVRIFNTYGPYMQKEDGRVVSNFIVQALAGQDITLYGDGQQTRSFCYVSDLVQGLMKMMDNDKDFIGPVNLGNDDELTVRKLADKVIALSQSTSKIVMRPLPSDDPTRRRPDLTLARKMLDWQLTVSLDEGLKKSIEYFKQER